MESYSFDSQTVSVEQGNLMNFLDKIICKPDQLIDQTATKEVIEQWKGDICSSFGDLGLLNVKVNKKLLLKNQIELECIDSSIQEWISRFYSITQENDVKDEIIKFEAEFQNIFGGESKTANEELIHKFIELSVIDTQEVQVLISIELTDLVIKESSIGKIEATYACILGKIFIENIDFLISEIKSVTVKNRLLKLIPDILINYDKMSQQSVITFIISHLIKSIRVESSSDEAQVELVQDDSKYSNSVQFINELRKNLLVSIIAEPRLRLFIRNIINEIILSKHSDINQQAPTSGINLGEGISSSNLFYGLTTNLSSKTFYLKLYTFEILLHFLSHANPESVAFITAQYSTYFNNVIEKCLVDFYPQMRYATMKFALIVYDKLNLNLLDNEVFMTQILPKICVNRYFPAEGMRKLALELWKKIVDMNGIKIIKAKFTHFLIIYLQEMQSSSFEAVEGGVRCLQELIMKVYDPSDHFVIFEVYYKAVIRILNECLKSKFPNVRISVLNASGHILPILALYVFGDELDEESDESSKIKIEFQEIFTILKLHLFDSIYDVRDSAGYCYKTLLEKDKQHSYSKFLADFNSTDIFKIFEDKERESTIIVIKERISKLKLLYPGFSEDIKEWEYLDGSAQLVKEFCDSEEHLKYFKMCVSFFEKHLSTLHPFLRKTVWKAINQSIKRFSKSEVDNYLDEIKDIIEREIKSKKLI